MKSVFRKLTVLALGLAVMAIAQPASAAFNGTLGLVATTTISGSNTLLTQNSFTFSDLSSVANQASVVFSTGNFTGTTGSYTTSTLTIPASPGTTPVTPFSIASVSTFGSFTAIATDGINVSEVVSRSANFLDVYFIGTYVGGPVGSTPTPASLRLNINYPGSGGLATVGFTLSIPPATVVPEPASIAMVVMGLGGLAVARRFRRRTV